jgi:hypothetical protein
MKFFQLATNEGMVRTIHKLLLQVSLAMHRAKTKGIKYGREVT